MLNDLNEVRHAHYLRSRMDKINSDYKRAFRCGFGISVASLIYILMFTYSKFVALSVAYVNHIVDSTLYGGVNFKWVPNAVQVICSILSVIFCFLAFKMKKKIPKFALLVDNLILFAASIAKLLQGEDFNISAIAILSCIITTWVCIDCMRIDAEEEKLSKIDGYPHFNPLLMTEKPPSEQFIYHFDDKSSMDELNDNRDIEYFEEHPDSDSAREYYRSKEEEREGKIDDWLGELMGEENENENNK